MKDTGMVHIILGTLAMCHVPFNHHTYIEVSRKTSSSGGFQAISRLRRLPKPSGRRSRSSRVSFRRCLARSRRLLLGTATAAASFHFTSSRGPLRSEARLSEQLLPAKEPGACRVQGSQQVACGRPRGEQQRCGARAAA